MEQYIWKQVGSVTERSLFLGKQKTNMERRRLLGKRTFALEKTKTKQMQRCNPPRFKTNRRTKGSGNHAIPYFEGFTTAAICQNQSERSPFHGTKTNGTLLQRCKSRRTVCGTWWGSILLLLGQRRLFLCQTWKQGSMGQLEGMEEAAYVDCYFLLGLFAV